MRVQSDIIKRASDGTSLKGEFGAFLGMRWRHFLYTKYVKFELRGTQKQPRRRPPRTSDTKWLPLPAVRVHDSKLQCSVGPSGFTQLRRNRYVIPFS